jgi:hypothetical protein
VAFVIAALKTHATLPALWATVEAFALPSWALVRPNDKLLPHCTVMDSSVSAPWAQKLLDQQLKVARERRDTESE